jgi:trk system potassium uptake protein TrkH
MNYRLVVNQLGLLLVLLSAVLMLLAGLSFVLEYQMERQVSRDAAVALAAVGLGGLLLGAAVWFFTRAQEQAIGRREALLLVAGSWIGGAAFAALPFFIWALLIGDQLPQNPFRNFANCYFESMSGLTTTGASVLSDIEAMPKSLLLWRSSLQWLGGLGIVVLFVAVLPSLGVVGKKLYRVEAGTSRKGLQPQIREAARILWYIYLGMTVAEILLLWVLGMPLFESICHTFATVATGGFSPQNESMAAYVGKPAILIVVIAFMFLGSVNFGLYNHLLRRRFDLVLGDVELRFYLIMLVVCIGVIAVALLISGAPVAMVASGPELEPTAVNAGMHSTFTAVSISTTTGFATADYNLWPFIAQTMLVLLMLVGGCSGSTAGGIKVIRIWIVFRVMLAEIERVFRPHVIRPVRIGGSVVEPELKQAALAYVLGAVLIIILGAVVVMLIEKANPADIECTIGTAAAASLSSFCTVGPGLDQVGPSNHYGWMTASSKLVLSLVMLLGRLEVFAIIVLFSPRFWRND